MRKTIWFWRIVSEMVRTIWGWGRTRIYLSCNSIYICISISISIWRCEGKATSISHRLKLLTNIFRNLWFLHQCHKYNDKFRGRWNNYKSKNVLKEEKSACKNICLIDKTDGSNPTKRENYWMQTLRTFHLMALML